MILASKVILALLAEPREHGAHVASGAMRGIYGDLTQPLPHRTDAVGHLSIKERNRSLSEGQRVAMADIL
jgi:hypothetical protein